METTWKFYLNPKDAWAAMLDACLQAQRSIDVNQYIFVNDEVGNQFLEVFKSKAKLGVKIRLVLDAVGSSKFNQSKLIKFLERQGIKIIFFNPIGPWRVSTFTSWFFRDHKKILVIDQEVAFTGGVGVNSRMRDWRDTHVRFTGPLALGMQNIFNRMWQKTTERKRFFSFKLQKYKDEFFELLVNTPLRRKQSIRLSFTQAIRQAKSYVYLTTPYFIPSLTFFRSLLVAAKRKVDVRLLVSKRSDHKIVDIASQSYYGTALRYGVKVYLYDDKRVLHTKTGVVDDVWSSVGSANLDNLSFHYNYEANVVATHPLFIQDLKQHFLEDLKFAHQLIKSEWDKRPRSQKILEAVTWPMHNFL